MMLLVLLSKHIQYIVHKHRHSFSKTQKKNMKYIYGM